MEADAPLPDDVPTLQAMVRDLQANVLEQAAHFQKRIDDLQAEVASLQTQLATAKKDRFGRKSERTKRTPKPEKPSKPKHKHGRAPLAEHLERRDTILDLTADEQLCPCCQQPRVCIGQTETEQLDREPMVFFVRRTIRKTYACQHCSTDVPAEQRIPTATPSTVGPIDKGLCGPGLLADVIVAKFLDHIPLHRQVGIIARSGVTIAESTLGDWVQQAAKLVTPLCQLMQQMVVACSVAWSDDTRSRFAQPGEQTMPKGHFWTTIGDATAPFTIFHFTTGSAAATGPDQFLAGFRGYLHADGLAQYNHVFAQGAKHVACWAHARRKFLEAGDSGKVPFEFIQKLYRIEQNLPPPDTPEQIAQRKSARKSRSIPILSELKIWLDSTGATLLPKDALAIAIRSVLNRWDAFVRYTEDGRLLMDNNLSERTLRLIAVGRANWKFVGSAKAGERAALLYTLTGTCRHLGLDAWAYLRDVLPALHALSATGAQPTDDQLRPLLPNIWANRQTSQRKAA